MSAVRRTGELGGFAGMIADLIESNLKANPGRAKLLQGSSRRVNITANDIDSHVGLVLGHGDLQVSGSKLQRPHMWIYSDSATLIELPNAKLLAGLPSLADATGRQVTAKLLKGQLKIKGIIRLRLLTKLQRLLSVS